MKSNLLCMFLFLVLASGLSMGAPSTEEIKGSAVSASLINQEPNVADAGGIVEVRIGFENQGDAAVNNLMAELVTQYPFELVLGQTAVQEIGTVNGFQQTDNMKIIKYKLLVNRNAQAGSHELNIKYYEKGSGISTMVSLPIDVKSTQSAEVIQIDKTTLMPGKEDSLKFVINNVGNAPLVDLVFSWENSDKVILPVGSDNTKYIKSIEVGKSAEIEYKVIADSSATAGLYKLDLHLSYKDPLSGDEKEISTIAGMYIGGDTDFEVALSETSTSSTSFSIANIGSNPATSVSVIILKQEGWTVTGANSVIIGNLNQGDYTVASYTLSSSQASMAVTTTGQTGIPKKGNTRPENFTMPQATTESPLKIQIAYTNTMGERKVVEKEVSFTAASSSATAMATSFNSGTRMRNQSFLSKYKWLLIGGTLFVVAVVFFGKYRRNKLLNPGFKFKDMFKRKR